MNKCEYCDKEIVGGFIPTRTGKAHEDCFNAFNTFATNPMIEDAIERNINPTGLCTAKDLAKNIMVSKNPHYWSEISMDIGGKKVNMECIVTRIDDKERGLQYTPEPKTRSFIKPLPLLKAVVLWLLRLPYYKEGSPL